MTRETSTTTIRADTRWLAAMQRLADALGVSRSIAIQLAPLLRDVPRSRLGLSDADVEALLDDMIPG